MAKVGQVKNLKSVSASWHHTAAPYSPWLFKGYRYPQMCHTNIAIAWTMSVYPAQHPWSIATYLKGSANMGVGSIVTTQTNPPRIKHTKKEIKIVLKWTNSKVTPYFFTYPQQSRQFCDTVKEPTINTGFAFVFANVSVSKSLHRLFFYPN